MEETHRFTTLVVVVSASNNRAAFRHSDATMYQKLFLVEAGYDVKQKENLGQLSMSKSLSDVYFLLGIQQLSPAYAISIKNVVLHMVDNQSTNALRPTFC